MPISGIKSGAEKSANAAGRTVFRPSWVKDSKDTKPAEPAPAPTTPSWKKSAAPAAASKAPTTAASKAATSNGEPKTAKLQSKEIKVPVVTTSPRKPAVEPASKAKPNSKVVVPEEASSSEYEEVTDSEEDGSEEEVTDSEEGEVEVKPAFAEVKLKPVDKPKPKVEKSPSVDRAGKFVKPVLKKVPKIDEAPKPEPPPVTIPEVKPLRKVTKPEFKEPPPSEPKAFVRPQLKKVDSISKKRK